MSKVALFNMLIGFFVVFLSAAAGIFLAFDLTEAFLKNYGSLDDWSHTLRQSAHGHFNLFGMLHILLGLTLSYSNLDRSTKFWQSGALLLGTLAMGPGLYLRALLGPSSSFDALGIAIGVGVSASLVAVLTHAYGLALKMWR